ncbi:MAG: hypothetical protein ACK416_00760 [Zestosphaera sp.]
MTRFSALLVVVSMLLLISAPFTSSHDVGDTYSYKVYAKIHIWYNGSVSSSVPSRLVLVINGSIGFSIIGLDKESVSLRLRPNLTISGEVEPSSFQQNLQWLIDSLTASMNRVYEVSIPLSVLGYIPYGDLMQSLEIDISPFLASLNITTASARFTTWRGVPALYLKFVGNITSTQYVNISTYVESESYLDPAAFLPLYFESNVTYSSNYLGTTINYVIEVKSELINIDVINQISTRAYRIRFDEGESKIYVASENLSISGLRTAGKELIMNISGSGIGGITIFITKDTKIQRILVDNTPAKHQVLKYSDGSVIRIPLTLSSREVRITFEETIKSVEEIPIVQTETNALITVLAVLVVPLAVLVALLTYLLKRMKSY